MAVVFLCAAPAVAAPQFTIVDLGGKTQGDWEQMSLTAVNNAGQVAGGYRDSTDSSDHAVVWDSGTYYTLPGPGGDIESAADINDAGVVSGWGMRTVENSGSGGPKSTSVDYPVAVWTDSDADGIPDQIHYADVPLSGLDAVGKAINNSRNVTGYSNRSTGGYEAFLWKDQNDNWAMDVGEITALGSLAPDRGSDAEDINAHDVVCGHAAADDGKYRPVVWSETTGLVNLGLLPDTATVDYYAGHARGINDDGSVVGFIAYKPWPGQSGDSGDVAVMWTDSDGDGVADPNTITPLPPLPGGQSNRAHSINNLGQIVGHSRIATGADYTRHAFLYDGGTMYDLNDLILNGAGWTLTAAYDISDTGYVLGEGDLAGGSQHIYRLNTPGGVIAEPVTMTLMLLGIGAAASRMRRRIR
jgi:probable HAF family extracellular repeat protein